MQPLPHFYQAHAVAAETGDVALACDASTAPLVSASPPEFGGPGGRWSPETLLLASVADCVILTFRSMARAADFHFAHLTCAARGTLDRVDRVMAFTAVELTVHLTVANAHEIARGRHLMERAERHCLISNSLRAVPTLEVVVSVDPRTTSPSMEDHHVPAIS